jgi:hypothetical protein
VLGVVQQNEEFRIKITKNYFIKFLRHVQTFGKKLGSICEDDFNKMSTLAAQDDLQLFIEKFKSESGEFLNKEKYQPY